MGNSDVWDFSHPRSLWRPDRKSPPDSPAPASTRRREPVRQYGSGRAGARGERDDREAVGGRRRPAGPPHGRRAPQTAGRRRPPAGPRREPAAGRPEPAHAAAGRRPCRSRTRSTCSSSRRSRAADADAIRAVIHAAYQAGTPVETLADRVIAPAMTALGHEWETGRTSVATEHRVTQACVAALYESAGATARERGAGPPGRRRRGARARPLHPADAAGEADAARRRVGRGQPRPAHAAGGVRARPSTSCSPRLVWVSVSHLRDPADVPGGVPQALPRAAEARGVAVAVGGAGLTPELRAAMRYTTFGDGMTQLAAFARSLHPPPARRGAAGRRLSVEL